MKWWSICCTCLPPSLNNIHEYMTKLPSISIVTVTYNVDLEIFKESLESINNQKYPKNLIEHTVIDGGSNNGTVLLALAYKRIVIQRPELTYESEMRKSIGIKKAKNDIILFLESDNVLVGNDWLKKMVLPFMEDETIFCTFSMHNGYKKNMSLLTKYCALIGASDPPVCYLEKADKMMLDQPRYTKGEIIRDSRLYTTVKFTKDNLPTFGDNGHMVRRSAINKVNTNQKTFLHTDAFFDLLCLGHDTYGAVKNQVIHYIGSNVIRLYQRRVVWKERYRDSYIRKRVYLIFDYHSSKDRWNMYKYILYSLTFVLPFLRAVRGYLVIKEPAWFLHPIVCFVALVMYAYSEAHCVLIKTWKK